MINNPKRLERNIINLLGLSIQCYLYSLKTKKFRNLEENKDVLTEIFLNAKKANDAFIKNATFDSSSAILDKYESKSLYVMRYSTKLESTSLAKKLAAEEHLNFVTSPTSDSSSPYGISSVIIPESIAKQVNNQYKVSNLLYTTLFDLNTTNVLKSNISISFPFPSDINETYFMEYYYKGIDIYDPNDEAIRKRCYVNKQFDYDLTQKYRKNHIYQKETFKGINGTQCDYKGYDESLKQYLIH